VRQCFGEGDYCSFKAAPFAVAATFFIYPECSAVGTATQLIRRHARIVRLARLSLFSKVLAHFLE
jgi:hypothetical protein